MFSFDTSLKQKKNGILVHFLYLQLNCANSKMAEKIFCFNFRKFYGRTQLQHFEQQNRRKSGQMKHPKNHVIHNQRTMGITDSILMTAFYIIRTCHRILHISELLTTSNSGLHQLLDSVE